MLFAAVGLGYFAVARCWCSGYHGASQQERPGFDARLGAVEFVSGSSAGTLVQACPHSFTADINTQRASIS